MRTTLIVILLIIPFYCISQTVINNDTCRTDLYYQQIGNGNKNLHVVKARTVNDHGLLTAGHINAGTDQQGLLIKQGMDGRVIWQKEYGNNAFDERFTDWRELDNHQLVVAGIAKNKATQQSVFSMALLTADGNITWQRSYSDIAPGANIHNVKIYNDYYGNIFFTTESDSSIIYGMITMAGDIAWQKSLQTNPGTKLVGVLSDYRHLLIATNSTESGFKVSNFYYIQHWAAGNPTSITSTIQLGGPAQNAHYILHDYEHFTMYTFFSGIRSVANNPYELVRVNIKVGYIKEALEVITTPGIALDSNSRTATNTYGDVISFTEGRKTDRLHAVKLVDDFYYNTTIPWAATFTFSDSIVLAGNAKTWDAGYNFMGIKELPGNNKQLFQLKTDSAAVSPSCIQKNTPVFSVRDVPFPDGVVGVVYNTIHTLAAYSYTGALNNTAIDTAFICRQTKCPVLPVTDSCLNSFQKLYESYNPGSYATGIQIINKRIFISGQSTAINFATVMSNTFIAEINKDGQVIRQRKYIVGLGSYSAIYKTKDSSLLLYGNTQDSVGYSAVMFAKVDTNLSIIWVKTLRISQLQYYSEENIGTITEGNDGNIFITYSDGIAFGERRIYLTKLNAAGNLLWSKIYRLNTPGRANVNVSSKVLVYQNHVYMTCVNAYNSYGASTLLKMDESNGNLVWSKTYTTNLEYLALNRLLAGYDNQLYIGGSARVINNDIADPILIKLDLDGNVLQSSVYSTGVQYFSVGFNFIQHTNGNIYFTGFGNSILPPAGMFHVNGILDKDFKILVSKKRSIIHNYWGSHPALHPDGSIYETGAYQASYNFWGNLFVNKYDPQGNLGICSTDTMAYVVIQNSPISAVNIPTPVSDSFFTIRVPQNMTEQYFLATSELRCVSVPGCNFLKVLGNDTICNRLEEYSYMANRNAGCLAPVEWLFERSNVQLIYNTDSSIRFRFLNPGRFLLKARLVSNCIVYTDSMWVQVLTDPPVLNLGGDTTLCPNAGLLLNAKKGFRNYLWQDGSSDSTFTVTATGLYHVAVTDSCNNVYRDSIMVVVNGVGMLPNLGSDTSFCSSNNVQLSVQPGFGSYVWQDGSSANQFNATQPGLYYVTVTDVCGNTFSDSIRISEYRRAGTLNLGQDTVACAALSMVLNAGAGFKEYLWQDGSTGTQFNANATGLYYVRVTDSCGTVITDSIRILPDTVVPFDIGSNSSICRNDSASLQAPGGFSDYNWWPLNNSVLNSPTQLTVFPAVNSWYYLSGIKQNGCMVKDSVLITVHNLPVVNIGADRALCAGDSLQLNAGNGFSTYTWSTGAQVPTVYVQSAGSYHVAVTDGNGCKAADSIRITTIPLPDAGLPEYGSICQNQSTLLSALPGFSSYEWNTGAGTANININKTGIYWVTVSNANGCKKTDTILVNTLNASPSGFLPYSDSAICSYDQISIAPSQNYQSYLWSNGATTKQTTVQLPGKYWLKVTDVNGCNGTDTMSVSVKDCVTRIYFPNSFTPNNDGLNDYFKPTVYGRLLNYQMTIYNRYGQKIFETTDVLKGWNATFLNAAQQTGAYVWVSGYQLAGEPPVTSKGTVLLLR